MTRQKNNTTAEVSLSTSATFGAWISNQLSIDETVEVDVATSGTLGTVAVMYRPVDDTGTGRTLGKITSVGLWTAEVKGDYEFRAGFLTGDTV